MSGCAPIVHAVLAPSMERLLVGNSAAPVADLALQAVSSGKSPAPADEVKLIRGAANIAGTVAIGGPGALAGEFVLGGFANVMAVSQVQLALAPKGSDGKTLADLALVKDGEVLVSWGAKFTVQETLQVILEHSQRLPPALAKAVLAEEQSLTAAGGLLPSGSLVASN